jgi:hypothetical protein
LYCEEFSHLEVKVAFQILQISIREQLINLRVLFGTQGFKELKLTSFSR